MNPTIQYERARERQAFLRRDLRAERLARRLTDPRLPALAAQLRDALLSCERCTSTRRAATEAG